MEAIVSFIFDYDSGPHYEDGRAFIIKFDVTPDPGLLAIANNEDDDFYSRMSDFLDELDINFAEEWTSGNCDILGWFTNCQDDHGDAKEQVVLLRDFLLTEGFRGGEITEMTHAEHEKFANNDQTQARLEAAIRALQ
jgi:hypothetical protein